MPAIVDPVEPDLLVEFEKGVERLEKETTALVSLSEERIGVVHTGRQNRALFTFAKLIAHCMSMLVIIDRYRGSQKGASLLDHFSLATLARAAIDASLMTMYISHPTLSQSDWNLRRHVLFLHDLTNRKRFLTSLAAAEKEHGRDQPAPPFFENYKEVKADLQQKITSYAKALRFQPIQIAELVKGHVVYVNGSRGAVREADWSVNEYDFNQSYLSSFVHSHPTSFINAQKHQISFQDPSAYQINLCSVVCDFIAAYGEDVRLRMAVFTGSEDRDPLGHID